MATQQFNFYNKDLGSGSGRDVYIASQLVGPTGKVSKPLRKTWGLLSLTYYIMVYFKNQICYSSILNIYIYIYIYIREIIRFLFLVVVVVVVVVLRMDLKLFILSFLIIFYYAFLCRL
ncbi:MAG: hypothetical protein ACI90V_007428 [Bacillariaceae sp.]|jgi:hypothetical protein